MSLENIKRLRSIDPEKMDRDRIGNTIGRILTRAELATLYLKTHMRYVLGIDQKGENTLCNQR